MKAALIAVGVAAVVVAAVLFYVFFGFYTLQPIGGLPEVRSAIVWRSGDEPFFNSPDGECLRKTKSVSLLCRGLAMTKAPLDRIIVRLPYMHWAYLASTDCLEFER